MLLLAHLLLLAAAVAARPVIRNHVRAGLAVREAHPMHNTLFLSLAHASGRAAAASEDARDRMLDGLEAAVAEDGCELSTSDTGSALLSLTIHCRALNNSAARKARAPLPALEATRRFLGAHGHTLRHLEYLQPAGRRFWYGAREHLDTALEDYFLRVDARRSRPSGAASPARAAFIEMMAQWALARIDIHLGVLGSTYVYNQLGAATDLYVMDTGIRVTHEEFGGRAQFLVNTVGDAIDTDCAGHGTMVASLAAGAQFGVAKGAALWAVKVLGCNGLGDTFTIVTGAMAVVEAAAAAPPGRRAVASLSLGGDPSSAIDDAMLYLLANNVSVVVAAGNEFSDACSFSPSRLGAATDVIVVGASDIDDFKPGFSNYGACVSISAPGLDITGAYATSDTATVVLSGTSMATPFVSGVLALLYDQSLAITPTEAKQLVLAWATPDVVVGASVVGGGANLLYSLIVYNATPNLPATSAPTAPPPQPRGPPPPAPDDQSFGSAAPGRVQPWPLLLGLAALLLFLG